VRAASTRAAPCAASFRAVASPTPLDAPVTTATLPARREVVVFIVGPPSVKLRKYFFFEKKKQKTFDSETAITSPASAP
jgi:hypothetical protein